MKKLVFLCVAVFMMITVNVNGQSNGLTAESIKELGDLSIMMNDYSSAYDYYRKAANMGDVKAMSVLAHMYYRGDGGMPRDYAKAVYWLQKLSDIGYAEGTAASGTLARMYLNGHGLPQSDTKFLEMYARYKKIELKEAKFAIAELYYNHENFIDENTNRDNDYVKAAKWYKKSADEGNADAMYKLGCMYQDGIGVPKSESEAASWWQKASKANNVLANNKLRELDERAKIGNMQQIVIDDDNRFSVSADKMVSFSTGNLQYNAAAKAFRFAEHQWDIIGQDNKNISSYYSGWIDLFGWATSGYDGNYPYNSSKSVTDYHNSIASGASMSGTDYDWGKYNTILNGVGINWRTLTANEWLFVFNSRRTKTGMRYVKATVNGIIGVILLPDNWDGSNYNLTNANDAAAKYEDNNISQNDWNNVFESKGAVFLPGGGERIGCDVQGSYPKYWSATASTGERAYKICIIVTNGTYYSFTKDSARRRDGLSVRLVCDIE